MSAKTFKISNRTHLSPKELGKAIGVSESSLKRWIDEGRVIAGRTAGGHRRVSVEEAVRFIREAGLPVLDPQLLGLPELLEVGTNLDSTVLSHRAFAEALQAGRAGEARGIVLAMYLDGMSMADICDGPIASAMHEIGTLWKHGKEGIYIEHRATDICVAALHQLRSMLPPAAADAAVAVGGAPTDDPYVLPTLAAAVTLAADGWRVSNLGFETPFDVLALAARESNAALAWMSVSVSLPESMLARQVAALADDLAAQRASLVIGGQGLPKSLKVARPNLHIAGSMTELAAFARGVKASRLANALQDE